MSSPLPEGKQIGRYHIRCKIGEGGMGEVYVARDDQINRDVAIKVLPAAFSAEAAFSNDRSQVRSPEPLRCFARWAALPDQLGGGRSQPHHDGRAQLDRRAQTIMSLEAGNDK